MKKSVILILVIKLIIINIVLIDLQAGISYFIKINILIISIPCIYFSVDWNELRQLRQLKRLK